MNGDAISLPIGNLNNIAKQKLHVILIVDTSRSMQGARIAQVNTAISDIHKYLIDLQYENVNVDFYMSIMTFANEASFLVGYKGVNVKDMTPPRLKTVGYSNLHLAYGKLYDALKKESEGGMMPDFGGIAPIILLITDGHPTKSTEKHLEMLKKRPWFNVSLRYGIAIELNDDKTRRVLGDFTEDKDCVIECIDSSTLAKIIRAIVLTASKVKSQSSAVSTSSHKGARIKVGSASPISLHISHREVKQEIRTTLDEIDDWEW